MKTPTCIDLDSDNTCPRSWSILAAQPGPKPSWAAPQFYMLDYKPGSNYKFRPSIPRAGHVWASGSEPLSTPCAQVEKTSFKTNPDFFWWSDGAQITNKLSPNPVRTIFFGHESGKNVNLLRSWLVSFCDNCLSSLKPPTRCTSSLTEME